MVLSFKEFVRVVLFAAGMAAFDSAAFGSNAIVLPKDREVKFVFPLLWMVPVAQGEAISAAPQNSDGSRTVSVNLLPNGGVELTADKKAEPFLAALPSGTKLASLFAGTNTHVFCEIRQQGGIRRCFGDSRGTGTFDYECMTQGGGAFQTVQLPVTMRYGTMGMGLCSIIRPNRQVSYRPIDRSAFPTERLWFTVERGFAKWDYRLHWGVTDEKGADILIGLEPFKWDDGEALETRQFGGLTVNMLRPAVIGDPVNLRIASIDPAKPLGCFSLGVMRMALVAETMRVGPCLNEVAVTRLGQQEPTTVR